MIRCCTRSVHDSFPSTDNTILFIHFTSTRLPATRTIEYHHCFFARLMRRHLIKISPIVVIQVQNPRYNSMAETLVTHTQGTFAITVFTPCWIIPRSIRLSIAEFATHISRMKMNEEVTTKCVGRKDSLTALLRFCCNINPHSTANNWRRALPF